MAGRINSMIIIFCEFQKKWNNNMQQIMGSDIWTDGFAPRDKHNVTTFNINYEAMLIYRLRHFQIFTQTLKETIIGIYIGFDSVVQKFL